MCLGVPGQVIDWLDHDPVFGRAMVQFDGIRRECQMACVPDAEIGEYVIVHAGIAISRIDSEEAQKVLDELTRLGIPDEFTAAIGEAAQNHSAAARPLPGGSP
ncbi:MAG: HypC/HybG/HupF family hydrogenase formation chaperone [Planctomycetota bacterium]|nr:MAG: HypC/HybG/HupF family hydrogenase formation chaperone [Planctomycetota bacterium]REJ96757.1 MAG: HypC/HybG/HupF family hydrogenase formation chaperone [Planctomycetota bacterium]REK25167.1 MAG: HypC/HybG/HupF family hydrogenase formation chaperone [Planctomycetota bacterium]REK38808.1 MAG: HypC/HybG/HupF family hydrogenase formation chaperone [Planctomycetota bacterium]